MTISATTQGLRMGVATSTSRPTVPFDGQVISETDTDLLKVYNGTTWVTVGPSGLVPIVPTSVQVGGGTASYSSATGKITATAATAYLAANGVFSSTYQNYLIQVMLIGGNIDIQMRFRVGGTDNTASVYSSVLMKAESGTGTVQVAVANENISIIPSVARTSSTSYMSFSNIQVSNPFSSVYHTSAMIDLVQMANAQPYVTRWNGGSNLNVTTSYDGFSLNTSSGSLTGNVQVYGYV